MGVKVHVAVTEGLLGVTVTADADGADLETSLVKVLEDGALVDVLLEFSDVQGRGLGLRRGNLGLSLGLLLLLLNVLGHVEGGRGVLFEFVEGWGFWFLGGFSTVFFGSWGFFFFFFTCVVAVARFQSPVVHQSAGATRLKT